ncbi:putative ankyrin repeat protein RBE_0317 isoform X1 [Leptopilina heterotoma]|uniref:putative ankyrin repeat protein RBE_0317 isoform X1 n=1 Tax=Leptopilina heterotoma TaxID=63436 RepID=UPI001CA9DE35|nr:putative ankyrin repeat protein RBE_0317 isoform X1 [Leptopilina heterotoma]
MCSRTLLHMAGARGHVEIAKLFTTEGDGIGNTQLHLAINGNQPEVFNPFLKESNLNARFLWDERSLHYTTCTIAFNLQKLIIENDAIIDKTDSEDETLMYVVLEKENVQIAEIQFKHRCA